MTGKKVAIGVNEDRSIRWGNIGDRAVSWLGDTVNEAGRLLRLAGGDHDYERKNMICPAGWGCTSEMISKVYPQLRNSVPGNTSDERLKNGKQYYVNGFGAPGYVKTYVGDDGLTINNVTEPDHPLHDGWVNRNMVQDKDGNWYSVTHGRGSNRYFAPIGMLNQIGGPLLFNDLDSQVKQQLYDRTHPKRDVR